jgi:hypothetical protein
MVVSVAVGVLVFALVVLFALLVADDDTDSDSSSRRCPGHAVGTVDPLTCLPYGHSHGFGGASAATNSGSSARKPVQQPRQKAPAAKAPAAPKAPAVPPRVSFGKK